MADKGTKRAAGNAAKSHPNTARGPAKVPGRAAPPHGETSRWRLWSPLVARTVSVAAGMLALAGIGAGATLAGDGFALSLPPAEDATAVASAGLSPAWLAPAPPVAPKPAASGAIAHPHPPAPSSAPPPPEKAPTSRGITADGKVVLNEASVEELTRLPGVGRKRAEAIVALRTRLKRFRKAAQLLRVRGIGIKSLRKMQPHLVLDWPREEAGAPEPEK